MARTGKIYDNKADALADGATEQHLRIVRITTILKGPFKGRRYKRNEDGTRGPRVKPDATKEEMAALIAGMPS